MTEFELATKTCDALLYGLQADAGYLPLATDRQAAQAMHDFWKGEMDRLAAAEKEAVPPVPPMFTGSMEPTCPKCARLRVALLTLVALCNKIQKHLDDGIEPRGLFDAFDAAVTQAEGVC